LIDCSTGYFRSSATKQAICPVGSQCSGSCARAPCAAGTYQVTKVPGACACLDVCITAIYVRRHRRGSRLALGALTIRWPFQPELQAVLHVVQDTIELTLQLRHALLDLSLQSTSPLIRSYLESVPAWLSLQWVCSHGLPCWRGLSGIALIDSSPNPMLTPHPWLGWHHRN